MIFVDEAKIYIKAGDGGKGCESFYKDNYIRYPRPNGGDGGGGGDIVFRASRSIQTLLDFRYKQHYKARKGLNGSSKGKKGKTGESCVLRVPLGTLIKDYDTGLLIKDLVTDEQTVVVAQGGRGGAGNQQRKAVIPPGEGEERVVVLELKLIADVGIIGFPNAGKSTFISAISRVRSKIADYPFTTKAPILGFVDMGDDHFIIADLPGIIEGAHQGKGLGDKFLKHAERTGLLVHMVDMAGEDFRDPLEDYAKILYEIREYGDELGQKERIVVANKMDLPGAEENLIRFKAKFDVEVFEISAKDKDGLEVVQEKIKDSLCQENSPEK